MILCKTDINYYTVKDMHSNLIDGCCFHLNAHVHFKRLNKLLIKKRHVQKTYNITTWLQESN